MRRTKQLDYSNPPRTLDNHPFFGLKLDEDQKIFRDAIWNPDIDIVFVDSCAGTGKTTIAVTTSVLMCKYGLFDDIVYIMHPVSDVQGWLPGTISEKSSVYFEALYQALIVANEFPDKVISNASMTSEKDGMSFVTAITDSYLRGSNIGGNGKTIMIIDECENYDVHSLRKVLTRACEGTKVIVIGHQRQSDIPNGRSGFAPCMAHFMAKSNPRFAFCKLNTCHRGLVARTADEEWI